jgi:hypothetical protein
MDVSAERLEREKKPYLEAAKNNPEGHQWVPGYINPSENGKPPFIGLVEHKIRNEGANSNSLHEQRQKDIARGVDVD